MLPITSVFAALIALLFLALSFHVIAYRRAKLISLGDHGDKALETRVRAQANCAEYAPLGLILLALVEMAGAPAVATIVLGMALLAGRLLHAVGFWGERPVMAFRVYGMLLTTGMIFVAAIGLLLHRLF
ncbi:hypothetical protein SAMN04488515_1654 [Cognatiyoonia koreensis]|uniref:MAPEG family protein n=1 Tax=Cognatiyoonia koreensis TaxID=364200 RepID=A0A1I0Q493_9RHOB|nr:MAPEG family protein [Cognatiyoonia koreensis]SEW21720.1 hypothetical protein SAMN04488515_1654 [Cognatiyoonia koreensis]